LLPAGGLRTDATDSSALVEQIKSTETAVARATEYAILFAATTLAGRKLNEVEGSHLHGKPTHRG